jgi:MFS family permease
MQLPRELGNGGPYFAMVLINALGYGLFAPFSILYFHLVVGLSLPLVGLGLTVATGVGLVATPLSGPLIDRLGARFVAVMTNLLRAVCLAAYLIVHSFAGFLIVALLLAAGNNSAGAAGTALVVDLAAPEDRDRWYALNRMAFNAGAGAGALLAGILVAVGGTAGYRWVAGLNGLSFALAAGLLLLVRVHRATVATEAGRGTYRTVLRDRPFLGLVGANTILWISVVAQEVALLPYLILVVHAPAWIVGLLFGLNTGMVVVLQMPVMRVVNSWQRTRNIAASGLGYGLSFLLFAVAPFVATGLLPFYLCMCMILYTLAEIIYGPTSSALAAAIAPIGMQGRYLAIFQLSLASAATVTPALAGSLLATSPQGLWLLLALLMVGAAGWIVLLERGLPQAALRTAKGATTTSVQQRAGDLECSKPCACKSGLS